MKRCPACGVERAHPSMFRDDTGRSTKNCKKCPQELEENPYAKTYGKRPTAPPTAHSAPGPAWGAPFLPKSASGRAGCAPRRRRNGAPIWDTSPPHQRVVVSGTSFKPRKRSRRRRPAPRRRAPCP